MTTNIKLKQVLLIGILFISQQFLFSQNYRVWKPSFTYEARFASALSQLEVNGENVEWKNTLPWGFPIGFWKRFSYNNTNLSLGVSSFSKFSHLDYGLFVSFNNHAYNTPDTENKPYATNYSGTYVGAHMDVTYKLKKLDKKKTTKQYSLVTPTLSLGIGYDYPVLYREKYAKYSGFFQGYFDYPKATIKDPKALNSGIKARFGIGILSQREGSASSIGLVYERKLYNFFNEDYENDEGIKIYDGYKTKIGTIALKMTFTL